MLPSLRMGRYIVEGLLGPGGVTETYLARLPVEEKRRGKKQSSDALFALKLLRPDRISTPGFADISQRFLTAGRQLREFRRPGFARVVDLSEAESTTFIVSEYLLGADMARLLDISRAELPERAGMDPALVALLGAEIARLLHVGHGAKPVFAHLGLCPQNIIVSDSGEVVLTDAGIAASLRAVTEQPAERWSFVAPELRGVDPVVAKPTDRALVAADLYSLGALLYFAATGHPPAVAPSHASKPSLGLERVGAPANLGAAVRSLLASDPDDRPESAALVSRWLSADIEEARERQRHIAERVSSLEKGAHLASLSREMSSLREGAPSTGLAGVSGIVLWDQNVAGKWRKARVRVAFPLALIVVALAALTFEGWRFVMQIGQRAHGTRGDDSDLVIVSPSKSSPIAPGRRAGADDSRSEPANLGSSLLARVAGHLVVETIPPGAAVWVDGVVRGRTFADIEVGRGVHQVVLIAEGHRMFREAIDTSQGAMVRRTLVVISPIDADAGLDVVCKTPDVYPILLDGQETGFLCSSKHVPAQAGKHQLGIFVPAENKVVTLPVHLVAGANAAVSFPE